MASWSDFHTNPRKSYYLFLRQEYQHPACVAHARVKGIDRMIAELQAPSGVLTWLSIPDRLPKAIAAAARRLCERLQEGKWIARRSAH
jgi:hypothetical protein